MNILTYMRSEIAMAVIGRKAIEAFLRTSDAFPISVKLEGSMNIARDINGRVLSNAWREGGGYYR